VVCRACDDEHPLIFFVNQPGGAAVLHGFRPAAMR
jgi:hypothetical protein